jgi:signal transduction histidine kinase
MRAAGRVQRERVKQRAIAERLLLGAFRAQDAAQDATDASARSAYLARASRDLSLSLDETAVRNTVRHLTLPRPGTWSIVDVLESDGAIHRLPVIHPDSAKQSIAVALHGQWAVETDEADADDLSTESLTITRETATALMRIAHGEDNLRLLREIGFGSMLTVPFIVRARVQGAMTFVSREGDEPFTPDEIALAIDLAARCAMALDNARLYREADGLRLAAESANRAKSVFLGSMSHELRTPLNAIGGFTELMEMGIHGPVTDDQMAALDRIKVNQRHLLMLINEILNFVRVEGGHTEYHNGPVPLLGALAEVSSMLSGALTEKGLALEGPTGDPATTAWADPSRVRQILVNLMMNAVKYTTRNMGVITLTCSSVGDMAVAELSDNGPGIAPENLQTIFEPFVQLTAGLANREGGVGLGLAISRDLARAMKGDLTANSTVGVGSRFTLTLPCPVS